MIISKLWITRRYKTVGGILFLDTTKHWKGYFLFGIIPLYIENQSTVYER